MKKRISIITLLIILVNLLGQSVIANAQPEKDISLQEDFCLENSFFDKNEYDGDAIVTRGEFTKILSRIAGLNEVAVEQEKWSGYVYEGSVTEGDGTLFDDVDASHPYYSSIKAVVDAGYMEGISKSTFAPDVSLTVKQSYATFLDMINYKKIAEIEGGYPKLARNLGITKGMSLGENDYISYKELAIVIYNMLDVRSYNFYVSEVKTFMSDIMKMKLVKGFLTDNGYTSLNGPTTVGSSYIRVGDAVIGLPKSKEYLRSYLGREVQLYYKFDEMDDENTSAEYIIPYEKTKIYTIESSDFVDYTGSIIKYMKNGSTKNISLSSIQYMIYNNRAMGTFSKDTLDIDSGEITVIPESYGGKSVIIVNSIEYAYVNYVDAERREIHNGLKNFDDVLVMDNYNEILITDENGTEKSLTDIAVGNILEIVRNSERININIVTKTEKNFYVAKIDDNDKDTESLVGENKMYDVSSQYFNVSDKIKIEPGKFYDLWLTSKNEVIWVEARSGDFQVGYLIRSVVDPDTLETKIVVSSMDGAVNTLLCDEKFAISDRSGVRHRKMDEEEIKSLIVGVNDLIRFTVNKDGLVNYIELPMDTLPDTEDRLYKIVDADDTSKWGGTRYPYQRGSLGFGGKIGVVGSVKVLKVPNSENTRDYTKYKKTTLAESFVGNDNSRRFIAYTTKKNTFAAEYIIAKSYENEVKQLKDAREFLAVDKVSTAILDEYYNVGLKITGYLIYGTKSDVAKKEITLYCDEPNLNIVNQMPDLYHSKNQSGNENKYKIQSGDIIRLDFDEDNYIEVAELVFRHTMTHPGSAAGTMGTLPGSIGYYDANNVYSNPVVIDQNGALQKGVAPYIVGTDFRLAMSWVNDKVEDVYQVTTQDLSSESFDPKGKNGKHLVDIMTISPTSMVLVEYEGGKVSQIRPATANDIRTREDAGSRCSRIIHNWYWGTGLHGFVINGL